MELTNLTPSQVKSIFDNSLPEFQKMIDHQLNKSTIPRLITNEMKDIQNDISYLENKKKSPFGALNNIIFRIPSNLDYLNESYAKLEKQHKKILEAKKKGKLWECFCDEGFWGNLTGYDEDAILLSDAICNKAITEVYLDDIKDTDAKLVIEYVKSEENGEIGEIEISIYCRKTIKDTRFVYDDYFDTKIKFIFNPNNH